MLVVLATAGSMAMVALALPLTSAATPSEKEFAANLEAQCVLGPGLLNERGKVNFAVRLKGPEEVHAGEEVTFNEARVSVTTPTEWTESLSDLGSRGIKGTLTRFVLDAEGMQPPTVNLAGAPEGIVPLEKGRSFSFSSPPVSFSEKVTAAAGEHAGLRVDSSAAYEEPEPGVFRETGKGIVFTLEAFNSEGVREFGPITALCTASSGAAVASYTVGGKIVHCTTTTPRPLFISLQPNEGAETGGTQVVIEGEVGSVTEVLFGGVKVGFQTSVLGLVVVSPPGHGTVGVRVLAPGDECGNGHEGGAGFTYLPGNEKFQQNGWALSGSLTDKRLGEPITLPSGSTFNGSGELNTETGAGSITGNLDPGVQSARQALRGYSRRTRPDDGPQGLDRGHDREERDELPRGDLEPAGEAQHGYYLARSPWPHDPDQVRDRGTAVVGLADHPHARRTAHEGLEFRRHDDAARGSNAKAAYSGRSSAPC